MRIFTFTLIFLMIYKFSFSQEMTWKNGKQVPVTPWQGYAPNHASEHQYPILTVRLSFHVMQMNGVHNNFENTWHDKIIIRDSIIKWLNGWYSDFDGIRPNDPVFPSDSFKDSRIRFSITDRDTPRIFFHSIDNDSIYHYNYMTSCYLYDTYVLSSGYNSFIKDSTMHIFLFAGGSGVGQATGHKGGLKITFWDECKYFNYNFPYNAICTLGHEIAHNMGLFHNYAVEEGGASGDDIDDTPTLLEGYSNNMMDYYRQTEDLKYRPNHGLSIGQLSKMRYSLMGFRTNFPYSSQYNLSHVVIKDWCSYNSANTITLNMNEHAVWTSPRNIGGDLVLSPGSSLTIRTTIGMPTGGSIIVQPGATLIIDSGGRITNVCDKRWKGIIVMGSANPQDVVGTHGLLILDSATIEHADTGIYLGVNPEGGGIVTATNTVIRNCRIGVYFQEFTLGNSLSYFKNCTFLCDSVLRQSEDTAFTKFYVSVNGTDDVNFKNNRFINSVPVSSKARDRGTGIYALNSSIKVKPDGIAYNDGGCYHSIGGNNIFENLSKGIEFNGGSMLIAWESNFINVQRAIEVKNIPNSGSANIWRNYFKVNNNLQYFDDDSTIVISISKASDFLIDTNTILFDSIEASPSSSKYLYGIKVSDCNNDNSVDTGFILKNLIAFTPSNPLDTMIMNGYAIIAKGNSSQLQIKCNEFRRFNKDWRIEVNPQLINQPASIPPRDAGNIFSYANHGQIEATIPFNYFYYNSLPFTRYDPSPTNGWNLIPAYFLNVCSETVCQVANYQLFPFLISNQNDSLQHERIVVFPNPASGLLNVHYVLSETNATMFFELINLQGICVLKSSLPGKKGFIQMNISNLAPGMYIYHYGPSKNISGKIILNK